jgi:ABC-type polar amino acid transport system ATPase subunit
MDAWAQPEVRSRPPPSRSLQTLEWIGRAANVCICGPSGTGKSRYVEALGHAAIDHGKTVGFDAHLRLRASRFHSAS